MSVARASIVMIGALIASRILGWLRLSVIGATFGATPQLDAFWAAFKIPNAFHYLEPASNDNARRAFFGGQQQNNPAGKIEIEKK